MSASFVDARFAGGQIVVGGGDFLERPVVRLAIPGANPVPLFPREARALAQELLAYAAAAEKREAATAGNAVAAVTINQEGI